MKLRKLFGIQTIQEKMNEYENLKGKLEELDSLGKSFAERFSIQKSIFDNISEIPEDNRQEALKKHNDFLTIHQKEVVNTINLRSKIIKSIDKMKEDNEVGALIRKSESLDKLDKKFNSGKISKKAYFDVVKAITGEPTRFSDVIVYRPDNKVLILHRVKDYIPDGTVCVPGGHVDIGETFEHAALRELKEETNLDPIKEEKMYRIGKHVTKDVHIEYFAVNVDNLHPVTLDASEHCFSEWIDLGEFPLKPFIFDQGKIIFNLMSSQSSLPMILKSFEDGNISKDLYLNIASDILKKSMTLENATPVVRESLEGNKRKLLVPVRDPFSKLCDIVKGVSGCKEIQINNGNVISFSKSFTVEEVNYLDDPSKDELIQMEVVFVGEDSDMKNFFEKMKNSLASGELKIRTLHEEFLSANNNGTDYIGDPIFSNFEN